MGVCAGLHCDDARNVARLQRSLLDLHAELQRILKVAITQADGTAVEEGAATQTPPNSGRWLYTATAAVPTGTSVRITVTATDTCPAPQRGARVDPATRGRRRRPNSGRATK